METLTGKPAALTAEHAREWRAAQAASRYRRTTVTQRERVLRRFMDFVDDIGGLNPAKPLAAHVTPSTVRAYVHAAWDRTPKTRFEDVRFVREAVLMLAPDADWGWLKDAVKVLRKDVHTLQRASPQILVPDRPTVLAAAATYVSENGMPLAKTSAVIPYRDAALVALVADTALRIGTIAALRMNKHLTRQAGGWFMHVPGALTKNGRPERARVSEQAGRIMDSYLAVLPRLSAGQALWRTRTGRAMAASSVQMRFPTAMLNVTGLASGPHAFRHAKAGAAVHESGSERAAIELGHADMTMTRRHYVQRNPDDVAPTAQAIVWPFD